MRPAACYVPAAPTVGRRHLGHWMASRAALTPCGESRPSPWKRARCVHLQPGSPRTLGYPVRCSYNGPKKKCCLRIVPSVSTASVLHAMGCALLTACLLSYRVWALLMRRMPCIVCTSLRAGLVGMSGSLWVRPCAEPLSQHAEMPGSLRVRPCSPSVSISGGFVGTDPSSPPLGIPPLTLACV